MIGTVATAAVSVFAALTAVAPATPPVPPEPGDETDPVAIERRLAEFSFAIFVTIDLEADPGAFTCSEPRSEHDSEITCFALVDEDRVIVAVTTSSEGTGAFDWEVVSDQPLSAGTPSTSTNPTTTAQIETTNLSDSAILSFGETLNRGAEEFTTDLLELGDGAVNAVNAYGWDPATATLTLDVTVDPAQSLEHDLVAWVIAQVLKLHWVRGEPFRLDGATLRPELVLVVSSTRYVSDFDLMVRVADQLITNTDWADAARQV